ncbi:hypothetical protein V2J09_000289 [Rumex salicifolius]
MAESEVKSAALWLGKLLAEEINHLGAVRDKVEELQVELNTLAAFLMEAVKIRRQDEVVRTVLSDARNVAYDCQDVIETYILEVARHGYEDFEGCHLGNVMRWACLAVNADSVLSIHSQIAELNNRISALKGRIISYGVPNRLTGATESNLTCHLTQPLRRIYSHDSEEYVVVGLENHLDVLVERLMDPKHQAVIAICGMGGIGKSTLARELYHHPKLRNDCYFDAFGWCHVSRQFQPNGVLQELMYSLVPENDHERRCKIVEDINANRAHAALYKMMKDEKCLVVIDDIWTSNDLAMLQAAFPRKNATGSRILLTTRNEETISRLDLAQVYLYPIKGLDEEKSWELFKMIALSDVQSSDLRKEELGREMLQHCNGVPLAIVVLGEVLKRNSKAEYWKQMRDDVYAQIKRGGAPSVPYKQVYDVLQVSYDELPFHLKHCFLHLANFPEDYEISTEKLFQLWVGEGIILKDGWNEVEENVADRYLNELVGRNMVQVASWDGAIGRIASCRLHDLMRDICIEMAKGEGFLQVNSYQKSVSSINQQKADHLLVTWIPQRDKRLRRLAVYASDQEPHRSTLPIAAKVSRAPNLRSLMHFKLHKNQGEGNCKKYVETISEHFPLLRVFDCQDFQIQGKLPKQVANLIHLRYLGLISTHVSELPSCIHKLQWLQTLDLRVHVEIVFLLPNILWKMKQLRHLYLPFHGGIGIAEKERISNAPQRYVIKGGGQLRLDGLLNLQTLVFIDLDRLDLKDLSKLERINIVSAICDTNKEALYPFLHSKSMRNFMLRVHARIINEDELILSSCDALHHLDIHADPYANFSLSKPLCLEMFPKCLVRVDIWYIVLADDPLPVLEKLPSLVRLGLHMCYSGTRMVCSAGGFPELNDLCFDELLDFCYWEVEDGALQKLKTLLILNCGLKKIPDALPSSVNKRMS